MTGGMGKTERNVELSVRKKLMTKQQKKHEQIFSTKAKLEKKNFKCKYMLVLMAGFLLYADYNNTNLNIL